MRKRKQKAEATRGISNLAPSRLGLQGVPEIRLAAAARHTTVATPRRRFFSIAL
jgi:hypothetical protein